MNHARYHFRGIPLHGGEVQEGCMFTTSGKRAFIIPHGTKIGISVNGSDAIIENVVEIDPDTIEPRKVKPIRSEYSSWLCPQCNSYLAMLKSEQAPYCAQCGMAIDWE